jgi:hypothetical protein
MVRRRFGAVVVKGMLLISRKERSFGNGLSLLLQLDYKQAIDCQARNNTGKLLFFGTKRIDESVL